MFDFVGNSVWQLVSQADFISKFVLLTLLFMSIVCWTLFIYKMIMIRSRLRDLNNAVRQLQAVRNADNLITIATALQGTVPGAILASSLAMLSSLLDIKPALAADILQYHIDQTVDTLMADEESSLPILSTSAAVSPLLGLFVDNHVDAGGFLESPNVAAFATDDAPLHFVVGNIDRAGGGLARCARRRSAGWR